jgi:phosphate transport system permease protein
MKAAWKEKAIRLILFATASTSILIVIGIFVFVGKEAGHFAIEPGLKELFGSRWMPVSFQKESFGLLPLITGSLLVTALATILTIPFGVGAAVYISELARPTEREILKPFIEILAGIPSVVIGFFGLVVLVPLIKSSFGL